ncbi:MAG: PorT family protein [Bacteroidaceae bacterium]|nr:PorT family protein [Bacteroidaceae bacterium]
MSKQWNKDIHDRLKDFQEKAPEGLLDDIKSEMHRRGLSPVPAGGSPFIRPRHILRAVSVAAILLIVSFIGYRWNKSSPTFVKDAHHPSELESIQPMALSEPRISTVGLIAPVTTKPVAQIAKLSVLASDILPTTGQEAMVSKEKPEQTTEEKEPSQITEQRKPKNKTPDISASRKQERDIPSSRKKTPSFAMGTHISGGIAQLSPSNGEKAVLDGSPGYGETQPDVSDSTSNTNPKISTHPNLRPKKKTEKHYQPIKFGISFRYNLNRRWNIQSGLTYCYLVSEFYEEYVNQSEHTKQKLHYIGIPLQIGYQVWKKKRFNGYIALGGQAEKLVSGKATTLCWQNNEYWHSYTKSVSDKHLTFSALASIGAEYHLGHTVSLYAEPSVHYYFKNGSGLENHYTKQPLNFNLTMGLRFHWGK